MTASAQAPSVGQRAEEQVRRTVKALRSAHDVSIKRMCEKAGLGRATYFSRMNGSTSFTAGEVAELADLFSVAIDDLYSGRITLGPTPPTPDDGATTAPNSSATSARNRAAARWSAEVTDGLAERDHELLPTG